MHGFEHGLFQSVRSLIHYQQHLLSAGAGNGGYQPPTHRQLFAPLGRNRRTTCGRHNSGVGRSLSKAQHSITKKQVHIGQAPIDSAQLPGNRSQCQFPARVPEILTCE